MSATRSSSGRPRLRFLVAGLLAPAIAISIPLLAADRCVQEQDLVADRAGHATHQDPDLVNAWGVAIVPGGAIFVADNHSGKATSYDGTGVAQPTTITIPAADAGTGSPTGVVHNATPDFVENGAVAAPATLIFASEDGVITAWNSVVDGTTARIVANDAASGAIYKGLAIANNGVANFLYAADFHNGRIAVFDGIFGHVTTPGGFTDHTIPRGYAPFNIQNVGGALYVTYARQDKDREDDVQGRGKGLLNVFDANGFRLRRFSSHGHLNAPWGVALSPRAFGSRLLVGNFGGGAINAFDIRSAHFVGTLRKANRKPVAIDGLWGIQFGDGGPDRPVDSLFFAAGPVDEIYGLFGRLDPCVTK